MESQPTGRGSGWNPNLLTDGSGWNPNLLVRSGSGWNPNLLILRVGMESQPTAAGRDGIPTYWPLDRHVVNLWIERHNAGLTSYHCWSAAVLSNDGQWPSSIFGI